MSLGMLLCSFFSTSLALLSRDHVYSNLPRRGGREMGHLQFGLELDHSTIKYTCNDSQTKQFTAALLINKAKFHF